ncbi:MAG: (Fe-S)-binding protein [Candidatus Pacearchaeota archaeon]|jgi:Fe-S oxidoreductase
MRLFSLFSKSNVLYFPGGATYFKFQHYYKLYQKIFSKLGIDFRVIDKNVNSGLFALEAGYEQEARKLALKNFEIFKEEKIYEILTTSPEDYKMFLQDYPRILPDWNISVKNVWQIILEKLKENPNLIKNKVTDVISYQDSCYLGRYCEIYNEPREILKLIGYEIKELFNSKSKSICCGSCGGLPVSNPRLANEIAKEKLLQVKRAGAKKVVVVSVKNYELLKNNVVGTGIEVLEFSEVLASALGIKIEDGQINPIDEEIEGDTSEEELEEIKEEGIEDSNKNDN